MKKRLTCAQIETKARNKLRYSFLFLVTAFALAGCLRLNTPANQPAPPEKPALRLTTEEILDADNEVRIIVSFPASVERPAVTFDDNTGQWVVSAKVKAP